MKLLPVNEHQLNPIAQVQDYTLDSNEVAQRLNGGYIGMYAISSGIESKQVDKFVWSSLKGIKK